MLKFRATNSMRARRAAEAQRKALEEKLKMEWAWKPMAAVMNEKETDLVYWVPPLYTSNLITSMGSTSVSSSPFSSKRSSLTTNASLTSPQNTQTRRRKLAQRRSKLSARHSIQEDECEDSQYELRKRRDDPNTDEDRESGIQDEYLDSSPDDDIPVDERFNRANHLKHSLKKLEKQARYAPKKEEKFRHIPTILKVLDKLSHIYTLPISPKPPMYGAAKPVKEKEKEIKVERKPRRPSVKIYRVPSQRASVRKKKQAEDEQPYYVISNNKAPFGEDKRFSVCSKASTTTSDRTHIGLPTLTENELRKAHLEMIIKILSNLYEEKLIIQNTEISQLKSKLHLQEKVIKQTAHLVLDMKDQIRLLQAKMVFNEELKSFYTNQKNDPESSFEYQRLESLSEEIVESPKPQIKCRNRESDVRSINEKKHSTDSGCVANMDSFCFDNAETTKVEVYSSTSEENSNSNSQFESETRNGNHISVLSIEIT